MKKILFSAFSLDVGGIETALLTLVKKLSNKYEITLALERKQGIFLSELPSNVKIITYQANNNKIKLLRKIINYFKQLKFKMNYKNKYDFAGCFATYSFPASFVARTASRNCALWVHNDYLEFYKNDVELYKGFFKELKAQKFKKIVFVSNFDRKVFIEQFQKQANKALYCNNLIDDEKIINLANEKVKDFKKEKVTTFINVGRHDEQQKRLSRIINAAKRLNDEGYKFRVVFVGTGLDSKKYKEDAKKIKNIEFLGVKRNPYPYIKNSDAMVLSSDYEGYPVVFVEAKILGIPIITTEVSDSKEDIDKKYGIVVEKSEDGVYHGMKQFLDNSCKSQEFIVEKYNNEILEKIEKIIEDK